MKKLIFPVILLILLATMSWVVWSNYTSVKKLSAEGKNPVTIATPLTGDAGKDGRSAYQVWLDNGHKGNESEFLNWLKGRDGVPVNGKDGKDGRDGVDGKSIKGDRGDDGLSGLSIIGPKGDRGNVGDRGPKGDAGTNGRTPELACVMRWDSQDPTVTRYFVAWRYTGDSSWLNLYKIPSQNRPDTGCKDLRS